jgi:hypothetical protein
MRTKLITLIAAFVFSWNAFAQEETCQTIILPEGWSFVSSYIEFTFDDAQVFYVDVTDNFIISKTSTGSAYLLEWAMAAHPVFNDEGFQVKMSATDTMVHCGTQIIPEQYPITLEQGWNIMPYLRDTPQDAEEALSSISSEIHLVKNILGQVYMPSWEYNGIGDLEPGKGYQIKMNSEQTLIYDANEN